MSLCFYNCCMYFTCNKNVNIYVGFVFNYTQSNIKSILSISMKAFSRAIRLMVY